LGRDNSSLCDRSILYLYLFCCCSIHKIKSDILALYFEFLVLVIGHTCNLNILTLPAGAQDLTQAHKTSQLDYVFYSNCLQRWPSRKVWTATKNQHYFRNLPAWLLLETPTVLSLSKIRFFRTYSKNGP
jgi:hypothetical protein